MMNWMIYSDRGGDYMRLIDANELEKVMTEDWFLDILLTQTGKSDMAKKLVDLIDSVPLSYNMEKVVEGLDDKAKWIEYETEDGLVMKRRVIFLAEAVNEVREGGVDNGVCKWKMDSVGASIGCRSDLHHTGYVDYKECPYCGKEIKVVKE